MEKLLFFDTETTGLDHKINSIHQLSGAVVIDGKIVERFNFKLKPHENDIISEQALSISKISLEQIMSYPDAKETYLKFIEMLSKYVDRFNKSDKFHLVGYNIHRFDIPFLQEFFNRHNDKYMNSWFWTNPLDCYLLASYKLKGKRHLMSDFKQMTVAKELGIEVDESKLHDAEYDVSILMEIYNRL